MLMPWKKWLSFLEGYFFVHNFSNKENITFVLLKVVPHVKYWWETYCENRLQRSPQCLGLNPPGNILLIPSRRNTTPLAHKY
jgi:hypothetical protein